MIEQGDELELLDPVSSLASGNFTLFDKSKGKKIGLKLFASEEQKKMLLLGGRLNEVKHEG